MKVTIYSVGKKPSGPEKDLIEEYTKRLKKPLLVEWKFISHHCGGPEESKNAESRELLKYLGESDYVLLLDERGELLNNKQFAALLRGSNQKNIAIIIGGSFGVNARVRERADFTMSISSLIFPHKLVRIILAEQLYRSQAILEGHPYHHE